MLEIMLEVLTPKNIGQAFCIGLLLTYLTVGSLCGLILLIMNYFKNRSEKRCLRVVKSDGFALFSRCNDCGNMTSSHEYMCRLCGGVDIDREALGIKLCRPPNWTLPETLGIYSKEGVNNALDEYKAEGYDISLVEKYRGK